MSPRKIRRVQRRITFEVHTNRALPTGEQVFVSGNVGPLGCWQADAYPLTRMDERVWQGTVTVEGAETVEYKVTRGSWETEEVTAAGIVPSNFRIKPGGDLIQRHDVAAWRDEFRR